MTNKLVAVVMAVVETLPGTPAVALENTAVDVTSGTVPVFQLVAVFQL